MLDVRPECLDSGFDEVRAEYGDFRSYLEDGLHIDAGELRDLKRELLAGGPGRPRPPGSARNRVARGVGRTGLRRACALFVAAVPTARGAGAGPTPGRAVAGCPVRDRLARRTAPRTGKIVEPAPRRMTSWNARPAGQGACEGMPARRGP
ncbi:tyrosine-protein phosphatase [Streptomyces sp. LN245]|uniref:tyrosine-protein phosphatase n=1 Tax=Streptomyces sp. LN245 TaxID=3112975 RepID=UPI003722A6A1